jgi:hypothetical protein
VPVGPCTTRAATRTTEPAKHKVVDHPAVGDLTVDCDVLFVATDDVRLLVHTAEPGTGDAERLVLAIVLGTQELVARTD